MPIQITTLRAAASRSRQTIIEKSLDGTHRATVATAFLCHSHKDEDLAKGLQVLLSENGWDLYIDWQDREMPERPEKETAEKIKSKIITMDWFLFLATPNSIQSRWCPWEIGFADSKKIYDRILIIPTSDSSGNWYGNEYLRLYRKIENATTGGLAAFRPGQNSGGTWIRSL